METEDDFQQLLEKAKAGDQGAAKVLFDRYKHAIRRAARSRIFSERQRRIFDSEDILQTVMKSFFDRAARPDNHWKLDTPESLVNLLMTMAKNKATDKARGLDTASRGGGGEAVPMDLGNVPGKSQRSPDELAEIKDLATKCWDRMPADLRGLYRMRVEERMSWDEIGEELDESAEACRKRLVRGLEEVASQFPDH
ncbi:MAG: sigma-70 family RNA polymerase sigma factor [Pirellulales bacterium]